MSKQTLSWIILFSLAGIWGSSFILMKKAMFTPDHSPIFSFTQVGAMRMIIAAIALLPFSLGSISQLFKKGNTFSLIIVGLCGNFLPAFFFTYAETGISSGYTGMLNSGTPIFALLIGTIIFKDHLTKTQLAGIGIGTIGVTLLMLAGNDLSMNGDWTHIAAALAATLCYGISLNTIKHKLSHLKSFEIASLSFLTIFIPSIIIALQQGTINTLQHNPEATNGLIYITILSVVGTAFALILFNRLVAISSVLFTSSVTYLIPIVAALIGIYFHENINSMQIIAMFIVIFGVFIANVLGKKKS